MRCGLVHSAPHCNRELSPAPARSSATTWRHRGTYPCRPCDQRRKRWLVSASDMCYKSDVSYMQTPGRRLMRRLIAGLSVSIIGFGAGCTMMPVYERPPAPIAAAWPGGPAHRGIPSEAPATDVPWRGYFADPMLRGVIEPALINNRDLRVAALNAERPGLGNRRRLSGTGCKPGEPQPGQGHPEDAGGCPCPDRPERRCRAGHGNRSAPGANPSGLRPR